MNWELSVRLYLEWLTVRNYSPATVRGRREYLSQYSKWCMDRGLEGPLAVSRANVDSYQKWLFHHRKKDGSALGARSQHARLVPVRAFFKWMAKQGHMLYNPASEMELPRLEKRLPRAILNASEAEAVLSHADLATETGLRDRALLEVLYSTGIRRMELCNLSVWDVDYERGTLMVRQGKGKKDRMVPIGSRALGWVRRYVETSRESLNARGSETLFLGLDGGPIPPGTLSVLVRRYVERSGVGKPGSCHLFRHTMATLMHENGADVRLLQEMLGHVDLSTTEIYTQVSIQRLKKVHDATHPAEGGGNVGDARADQADK